MKQVTWKSAAAALLMLAACSSRTEETSLAQVRAEQQANKLLYALELGGVHGARKQVGPDEKDHVWNVLVPAGQFMEAERVRQEFGLPNEGDDDLALLPDGGLLDADAQSPQRALQRRLWIEALRMEASLERTPDILVARVHYPIPSTTYSGERLPNTKATASVLLRYLPRDGAGDERPLTVEQVQKMIAGSVEGLLPGDVTVVYSPVRLRATPKAADVPAQVASASEGAAIPAPPQARPRTFDVAVALGSGAVCFVLAVALLLRRRGRRTAVPIAAAP